MTQVRKIHKTIQSKPTLEGAGVHLHRAFGGANDAYTFDPFLLLDDFRNDSPANYIAGFPWHPHRGIETITYMLRGEVEHRDSMGNQGVISAGDMQWMTAGGGILHQEMPMGDPDGRMYGFQLWANLPAQNKMINPRYQEVKTGQIPMVTLDGNISVRVLCGEVNGVRGPVENIVINPQYLDFTIPAKTRFSFPTPAGHTVFVYVIDGAAAFCDDLDPFAYEREGESYFDMQHDRWLRNRSLVLFEDGDQILINTGDELVRFLLISGQPIREPIAWYGPIVMNTQAELRQAFNELNDGTFIKKG